LNHFCFIRTTTSVMLSRPFSSSQSGAMSLSSVSSVALVRALLLLIICSCNSDPIYSLLFIYQIPSQPKIINSALATGFFFKSGFALIICYYGFMFLVILYSWSPKARDRFKFPFTRPSITCPPAFFIRFSSISSSGLWSTLIFSVLPLLTTMHRESPAFAT
jgi:hypothetical protein